MSSELTKLARGSAGWGRLTANERATLAALFDGVATPWSIAAAPIARRALADAHWNQMSADEQAAYFRAIWTNDAVRPLQVSFLRLAKPRAAPPFTLAQPVSIGHGELPGGAAEALRWDLTIAGRVVSIFGPSTPAVEPGVAGEAQLAFALGVAAQMNPTCRPRSSPASWTCAYFSPRLTRAICPRACARTSRPTS